MLNCSCKPTFGSDDEKECFQGIVDYMSENTGVVKWGCLGGHVRLMYPLSEPHVAKVALATIPAAETMSRSITWQHWPVPMGKSLLDALYKVDLVRSQISGACISRWSMVGTRHICCPNFPEGHFG